MSIPWSNKEVELIIADYFNMLSCELKGEAYSKAGHRRVLLPLLLNRSKGSIEFKHQNISAVLINLGQPYIKGYLPRFNFQKVLEQFVISHLVNNLAIEKDFRGFAEKKVEKRDENIDFKRFIVDSPIKRIVMFDNEVVYKRNPIKVNYLRKEQQNRSLGEQGEQLVLEYEKWNLVHLGKDKLAEQVRWISREEGDGAGFDILSRNLDGSDKYIEVKTTKLGKDSPFYFSNNELIFSQEHSKNFHLHRLFSFGDNTKMFTKKGSFDSFCNMTAMSYKGYF